MTKEHKEGNNSYRHLLRLLKHKEEGDNSLLSLPFSLLQ
jgi:hypothetical protein